MNIDVYTPTQTWTHMDIYREEDGEDEPAEAPRRDFRNNLVQPLGLKETED